MPLIWSKPYKISQLLQNCHSEDQDWPPHEKGVYLVTLRGWRNEPSRRSHPLYIGGNTGVSERFCTRIGDLIADLYGFFDGNTGHHSGGQSLYWWCQENKVHPGDLYLAWATRQPWCSRCAEIELASIFVSEWESRVSVGLLNKSRPPACLKHGLSCP